MSLMKKNKVKFGLESVHYAVATEDEDGNITYGTPKPIKGAVSLSVSPQGEPVEFHADNGLYFNQNVNDGYQGDLEIALTPDEFAEDCLGETKDKNGVIVENAKAMQKHFALLYEFTGDATATRHVLYYCIAARPNIESETKKKTVDPKTEKLSLTASQHPKTGNVKVRTSPDTDEAVYNNWYKEVYEPEAT